MRVDSARITVNGFLKYRPERCGFSSNCPVLGSCCNDAQKVSADNLLIYYKNSLDTCTLFCLCDGTIRRG